ncbi:CD59 glycoprotein-like [Cynoglossus semilaevis]|uniref:CD59 glycoprotein-like n=1 Tax=Cynoglossus semilaevis TaxID=244447 RepID=UPI0004965BEA|nr:CD59 glycoprotein-like [Cynoglossus semilaevis]
MKTSVAFWLGISFALFGFGSSLQCYSCPGGSTSSCEVKQDCNQGEDSCLTVKAEGTTYTSCVRYADCDFMTLAVRFTLPGFEFSCCQSNLCNAKKESLMEKFKNFFG